MLPIEEFKDIFNLESLPGENKDAYQTLGGFLFTQLGRVPTAADHFTWSNLRFEIVDMDGKRIDKVLVNAAGNPRDLQEVMRPKLPKLPKLPKIIFNRCRALDNLRVTGPDLLGSVPNFAADPQTKILNPQRYFSHWHTNKKSRALHVSLNKNHTLIILAVSKRDIGSYFPVASPNQPFCQWQLNGESSEQRPPQPADGDQSLRLWHILNPRPTPVPQSTTTGF